MNLFVRSSFAFDYVYTPKPPTHPRGGNSKEIACPKHATLYLPIASHKTKEKSRRKESPKKRAIKSQKRPAPNDAHLSDVVDIMNWGELQKASEQI